MKSLKIIKIFCSITLTFCFWFFTFNLSAQNVGINATGAVPDASALLDLSTTDKGFLITRVDTANIPSPAFGLMTLAPIDTCLYLYNGLKWMGLGGGGSNCSCNCSNPGVTTPIFPCDGTVTTVVDVTNPITGKTWMDRNLGASQQATNGADVNSYGDLYQWGRCSDGHEKRTSGITTTLSTTDTPGHGDMIMGPTDWRSPLNNNLWQGLNGINNPCPTGYRIPTGAEMDAERLSWSSNDATGAFASPLKLPMAGDRFGTTSGVIVNLGTNGFYWTSTVSGTFALKLNFVGNMASVAIDYRRNGNSVRCIKD